MPRKLPWKTRREPEDSPPVKAPGRQSPRAHAPARRSSSRRAPEQGQGAGGICSPSTSPPPVPPVQQFMIAGPRGDDRFRMVEDELLDTARLFTAHLHRAEYTRLKKLAAAQNAAAIREIERPVVPGPGTAAAAAAGTRCREAASRRRRRGGEAGPAPWVGSSLQGLMETRRGREVSPAVVGGRSGGSGVSLRPRPVVVSASSREPGGTRRVLASSSAASAGAEDRAEAALEDDGDEDDPFGVRERRARREREREMMRMGERRRETPKKLEEDTIPWFF
ncbi:uncharacterized protein MAM_03855 [Metarhizium album ARSEF 1941]|uniref:Uncharacterized protein n=1 Tax=Metarhizium album (strain ARSEF 1941) TaxID=1081103 RepID=A0A0B2WWW5_METAS|nr:uncharacterized protein MAM_03855 [Metarhizium album ARSEF 1941]KHN98094.1 hypothetical protein MAM_03855 [Metarhizium album ARSEF 1941]